VMAGIGWVYTSVDIDALLVAAGLATLLRSLFSVGFSGLNIYRMQQIIN